MLPCLPGRAVRLLSIYSRAYLFKREGYILHPGVDKEMVSEDVVSNADLLFEVLRCFRQNYVIAQNDR